MRWIVVGIGNPGPAYEGTRHNVGFVVLDKLAAELGLAFEPHPGSCDAAVWPGNQGNSLLLKPQSYVNRSGEALMAFFGAEWTQEIAPRILVIVDDIALAPGVLRFRARGSDGGHNGLKSLARNLGTQEFSRLRVGVGGAPGKDLADHVLSPFSESERSVMDAAVGRAVFGLLELLHGGDLLRVQEQWNRGFLPAEERVRETGKPEAVACAAPVKLAANHGRIRNIGDQPVTSKLKKYEGMFLLHAGRLAESEQTAVARVTELLKRQSIEPLRIDIWDERRLAYPIEGQKRGTYVLAHFEAPPETITHVNRDVNITEDILRVLITVHPKKFPDFKTAAEMEALRPRRDDDRGPPEGSRFGSGGGRSRPAQPDEDDDFAIPDLNDDV